MYLVDTNPLLQFREEMRDLMDHELNAARRKVEFLGNRANTEDDLYLKRAYTVNYITALVELGLLFAQRGLQKDAYSIERTLSTNGIRACPVFMGGGKKPRILWQYNIEDEAFRYGY